MVNKHSMNDFELEDYGYANACAAVADWLEHLAKLPPEELSSTDVPTLLRQLAGDIRHYDFTPPDVRPHEWEVEKEHTAGVVWKCKKCGHTDTVRKGKAPPNDERLTQCLA